MRSRGERDRLTSFSSCLGLRIQIADEPFEIDCYGLALGSFDIEKSS
jgi:hypothetical protein